MAKMLKAKIVSKKLIKHSSKTPKDVIEAINERKRVRSSKYKDKPINNIYFTRKIGNMERKVSYKLINDKWVLISNDPKDNSVKNLNKKELLRFAKLQGVKNISNNNKKELIDKLEKIRKNRLNEIKQKKVSKVPKNMIPRYLYHVTPTKNLKSIRKDGLTLGNVGNTLGDIKGVYITNDPKEIPKDDYSYKGKLSIIKIDTKGLDLNYDPEFHVDYDDIGDIEFEKYFDLFSDNVGGGLYVFSKKSINKNKFVDIVDYSEYYKKKGFKDDRLV